MEGISQSDKSRKVRFNLFFWFHVVYFVLIWFAVKEEKHNIWIEQNSSTSKRKYLNFDA